MFYFYILENEVGLLYFGSSNDLKRRLKEHQSGKTFTTKVKGSQWVLIYYEAYKNETDARERERRVKNNGGTRHYLLQRIKRSRQFER